MALFAPSAYFPLISILRWLALWVLAVAPISGGPCVCVGFLSEEAELCLLSLLLLGVGLSLVGLFWGGFCASSWGTCGFPRCVLQLVILRLADLLLQ